MNFTETVENLTKRIDWALNEVLPGEALHPVRLHQAMRYSVLNGGKRIRPLLVYGTGMLFEGGGLPNFDIRLTFLDRVAVAVELIHAYSLIHDDLPAMDNDDLRRGKPTCHCAFDEATAILAGDALQALAFAVLAGASNLEAVSRFAALIGSTGMAGGQALDLSADSCSVDRAALEEIYAMKTGALMEASVTLSAISVGCMDETLLSHLKAFALAIGVAFQIQDDILDLESATEVLGKPQGAEVLQHKTSYPLLFGLDASKRRVVEHQQRALHALSIWGEESHFLRELAAFMVSRDR